MAFAIAGYNLRQGSPADRARLVQYMGRTLRELGAVDDLGQVATAVEAHLAPETPLWWVFADDNTHSPVACLWLGNAQDQRWGDRHAYILLLYVDPPHRRRGIATALLAVAEQWATVRGDRRIGLQVFTDNSAARRLYERQGYATHILWMTKPLNP
jgi:GNAT superfamily N-acetyltransferase